PVQLRIADREHAQSAERGRRSENPMIRQPGQQQAERNCRQQPLVQSLGKESTHLLSPLEMDHFFFRRCATSFCRRANWAITELTTGSAGGPSPRAAAPTS